MTGALVCPLPPVHLRLSGLALGASAAFAGLVLGRLSSPPPNRGVCEACNGDGFVDCMCMRWANASGTSVHCSSCGGSMRTRCPRCRGGGTAVSSLLKVPIPVRIKDGVERMFSAAALVLGGRVGAGTARRGGAVVSSVVAAAPGTGRRRYC